MSDLEAKSYTASIAIDQELSKLEELHVHVLSDSVLCLVNGAMANASARFTKRWTDNLGSLVQHGTRKSWVENELPR